MDTPQTGSREPEVPAAPPVGDRVVVPPTTVGIRPPVEYGYEPIAAVAENVVPVRNRVQWGPIVGGLVMAVAIFVLMTILGIAIGASVLDPANSGRQIGTWAAIWGAISAIVAFFVGGWLAARTAAVGGSFGGLINGLMVGVAGLLLVLYLTGVGLGNLFGTLSYNLGGIIHVAQTAAQSQGITPEQAQGAAQTTIAQADTQATFDAVRNSAFGTFLVLLLPPVAGALGGYVGHNTRGDLLRGTG